MRLYSGTNVSDLSSCYLDQDLHIDPEDFIELCQDLENTFNIDLRPFFEDGQPERGRGPWRRKVARDVTVAELSSHIESLLQR